MLAADQTGNSESPLDIVAAGDGCLVSEHCAVGDVECLCVSALAVDVVQDDFIGGTANHCCVCGCATDAACTDDAELGGGVDTVHCCMPSFVRVICAVRVFSRGMAKRGVCLGVLLHRAQCGVHVWPSHGDFMSVRGCFSLIKPNNAVLTF